MVLGHYGIEVEEKDIVLFVGVIPIAIDVLFKYWIFIGLNRISPGERCRVLAVSGGSGFWLRTDKAAP